MVGGPGVGDLGQGADPVLTMGTSRLPVEPGGQVQLQVTVRNPGRIVESYRIDVVGLDESWWQALPPELRVFPGKEESAVVVLRPPQGAVAGHEPLPFGVRVVSLVDQSRCIVEEGDLEVGRVLDLQSQIVPVTARARWSTTFRVGFNNWGNAPVALALRASDPDQQLGFAFSQNAVNVPIGGSVTVRLRVRPRKPFLRGTPVRLPFTVTGEPAGSTRARPPSGAGTPPLGAPDPSRPVLDAAVEQRPVLSLGLGVLAALVIIPVALVGAWVARLPDVVGAIRQDVAPGVVTGVTAEGISDERVRVTWVLTERATGYQVTPVDKASFVAIDRDQQIDGNVTQIDLPVPVNAAEGCFTVRATRTGVEEAGPPSQGVCGNVLDASLPGPTGVTATPNPDGTLTVTWAPQQRFAHHVLIDGAVTVDVPRPGSTALTGVVPPSAAGCVRVVVIAYRGDDVSPEDAPGASTCVQPVPATATPSVSPTVPAPPPTDSSTSPTTSPTPSPSVSSPSPSSPSPPSPSSPTPTPSTPSPSSPSPTSTPGTAVPTQPWVAQLGPLFPATTNRALALVERQRAVEAGLPSNQVLLVRDGDLRVSTGFPPDTLRLVFDGFGTEALARAFCGALPATFPFACVPLETGLG